MSELPIALTTDKSKSSTGLLPAIFTDPFKNHLSEQFHGIESGDAEKDRAIYEIWLAHRKQQALEAEMKSQLAAKIEEHVSTRRPKSAGTNYVTASRFGDLKQRPLSAIRRLAQMVASSEKGNSDKPAAVADGDVEEEDAVHSQPLPVTEVASVQSILPPLPRSKRPVKRHDVYLYLSDSDDDVDRPLSSKVRNLPREGTVALNKSILARERPASSRRFYELASTDPELKVISRVLFRYETLFLSLECRFCIDIPISDECRLLLSRLNG